MLDGLPPWLLRSGPLDLLGWQWAALPVLAIVAWLLSLASTALTLGALTRLSSRTAATWDDALVARLAGPIRLGWWLGLVSLGIALLELSAPAARRASTVLSSTAVLAIFWGLLRGADVLGHAAADTRWAAARPFSRALLPLAVRSTKVAIVALALVAVLSAWGVPVASLLAGLGIGGLALALAAQKTVENLFGSFSIGVDQPFREGDFVKVEDFVGTVESIGLRSTRFRTLDRTIISIPNGKLADMRIETFAARDRIRLACVLGLVYGTTAAQLREVRDGVEARLRAHPLIWPDAVVARFGALGATALEVEVMAWFRTSDWGEFQAIREELLLGFMEIVERAGTSIAFPTRTVHLEVARRARPDGEARRAPAA